MCISPCPVHSLYLSPAPTRDTWLPWCAWCVGGALIARALQAPFDMRRTAATRPRPGARTCVRRATSVSCMLSVLSCVGDMTRSTERRRWDTPERTLAKLHQALRTAGDVAVLRMSFEVCLPTPSHCLADGKCQLQWHLTDSNRPHPLWQPPPFAYLTASWTASEAPSPSRQMQPCSPKPPSPDEASNRPF